MNNRRIFLKNTGALALGSVLFARQGNALTIANAGAARPLVFNYTR